MPNTKSPAPYQPISATNFPNATKADATHAGAKTDVKYGAPREALDAAMRQIQEESKYQTDVQREMGGVHDTRLGEISQLLNQQLGQNTERIQGVYGGAQDAINRGYGEALLASEGASQSVLDNLRRSMERLGLEAAEQDGTGKILQQLTDNRALNTTAGAGAVGNIANLGADMTAIATKAESDALQEWAGKRDEFAKRIQNAVMQINQDYNTKRNQLLQEISSLERTRGADFVATLTDTINERLERERADRMERLQAEIQRGNLAVQRGHLNLAQQKFAAEQKQLEKDLKSEDPLKRQAARVQMLELQKRERELTDPNFQSEDERRRYTGIEGVNHWAQDQLFRGSKNPTVGAQAFTNKFTDFMHQAQMANQADGLGVEQHFSKIIGNPDNVPPQHQKAFWEAWMVANGGWSSYAN